MSKQIFERHVDEHGNVSVRISDKFVVLTHDKAELIKAKFDQLEAENAKLRKYVNAMAIQSYKGKIFDCGYCPFHNQCYNDEPKEHQGRGCQWWLWARELGIEVTE